MYSVTYIVCYGVFRVMICCAVGTKPTLRQGTPNPWDDPLADFIRSRSGLGTESKALSSPPPLPPPRDPTSSLKAVENQGEKMSAECDWTRRDFPVDDTTSHVVQLRSNLLVGIQQDLIFAQAVLQPLSGGGGGYCASDESLNDFEEVVNE